MKQKFLTILYEMGRKYARPFARYHKDTREGWCWAFETSSKKINIHLSTDERSLFYTLMREEGNKLGADFDTVYWWSRGAAGPRRKLINAVIKRLENSNI